MKLKNKKIKLLVLQSFIIMIGVLVIVLVKSDMVDKILPTCIFRQEHGVICPTCGATRCIISFLNLNFESSFKYHPVLFLLIIYLIGIDILFIINTIFKKKFLKFMYPSIPMLCTFLSLHVIYYFHRICIIISSSDFNFL